MREDERRALLAGLLAPVVALRRSTQDPVMVRVQLAWAAVMTASWAATVSLAVVAYDAGGSGAVALAVLARSIPGALAGPAVGSLVDRQPRRRMMTWAAGFCAAASAGAAAVDGSVVAVAFAVTLVALATMVFRAAQSAVMPELVSSPTDLTAANVLSSAIESVGVFAGPALAGLLLTLSGPTAAFLVAASLFAVAAALLHGPPGARPSSTHEAEDEVATTRALLRLAPVRLVLLLLLAQTVVGGGLVVLYAALAVDELAIGDGGVGLLTSAFGLGGVVGSLGLFALAGSSRLGGYTALALLLWSLPLVLVPAAPEVLVVLLLLALVGGGNVLFDVTTVTLLQRAVPAHLLGRAFGALETVVVVGLGAGALVAPVLESVVGPAGAVALLGAPLAVVAVLTFASLRRLDAQLEAPVRQVALLRALAPFALLPTPALERLALLLQRVEVATGGVVVQQGEPGQHWYLVDSGELQVSVDGRDVARLSAGEAFGEIALLRQGIRTATVTALAPAALWSLSGDDFLGTLGAHGEGGLAAADEVARAHLLRAAPAASLGAVDVAEPGVAVDRPPSPWVAPL